MNPFTTLGAEPSPITYVTPSKINIQRHIEPVDVRLMTTELPKHLDRFQGALFSSGYEYTGRYSKWDIGFINPPLEIRSSKNMFQIRALNDRGELLLPIICQTLLRESRLTLTEHHHDKLVGVIHREQKVSDEADRTKQPSVFDVLRLIRQMFQADQDVFLGLYGAFGYDLIFQFEQIEMTKERPIHQNDLHLFLPDELYIVDHQATRGYRITYEFMIDGWSTKGLDRDGKETVHEKTALLANHSHGFYANLVRKALPLFDRGDLFEVVPTQVLYKQCPLLPSEVFNRLKKDNPSPYGFMIHIGRDFLIGASPEMYVRVEGRRVETCPISGTIKRGRDAIEDAHNIKTLLNSAKDEAELTMCTDVDRNDKSRICLPGSVRVIGRRQIEMYAHLFHTVDHIVGELRPDCDALDAFITHMWAVTVTGAPKLDAMRWIEENEEKPRGWYGGAVGWYTFDGNLNTGLTLRTAKISEHLAEIRVGATILHASIPEEEEKETEVKVAALAKALDAENEKVAHNTPFTSSSGQGKQILIVDHEDSFVHTLANYFRQTGGQVAIYRSDQAQKRLEEGAYYDLAVLSPGPGKPDRFDINHTIDLCIAKQIPIFGVCLGFQGIADYFGGTLGVMNVPSHGQQSDVIFVDQAFCPSAGQPMKVGRYHSLYVKTLPDVMEAVAFTEDGVIMAAGHQTLPIFGVQFHPESILSADDDQGLRFIDTILNRLTTQGYTDVLQKS